MKKTEGDILQYIAEHSFDSQRRAAEDLGYALGSVNQARKSLQEDGMLDGDGKLTREAREWLEEKRPRRAVILAAGTGMRMVPINQEVSKGMLEVKGEPLAERLIRQLLEAGISEIYVVVGFMKEQYEYLMDQYGVELIVNREYEQKNNLCSLAKAVRYLDNAYVIPCDLWCAGNPFHRYETYSWYLVGEELHYKSNVLLNRKGELVRVKPAEPGNRMIGIAYLEGETAQRVRECLLRMNREPQYEDCFWEESLYDKQKMLVLGKIDRGNEICEINTFEQLRQLDSNSSQLDSRVLRLVAETFAVKPEAVKDIQVLKKGMTNRSFRFRCKGRPYIMRIPGEGTGQMINREQEYQVYRAIQNAQICDDVFYMNPENGYKITEFLEEVHNCDPEDFSEVKACMQFLRRFHEKKFKVEHRFDLFGQIEFYESLWATPSVYRDYEETKKHVLSLKAYIDSQEKDWGLTHIDAVPDNFLLSREGIRLIDWEYAGMQDPHLDIAMFAVYSMYTREQVERLIDCYFPEGAGRPVRKKIYCYIAAAGLLWSNWCEYKRQLGVEFGEYSLRQYRFAKEYYRVFQSCEEEERADG